LAVDNSARKLSEPPRSVRLSDAEKIASERLESASITSLKAALAGVASKDPFQPRLVERIDAAARLAADATAAAEAVERLKSLLQAQLAASTRTTAPEQPLTPVAALPAVGKNDPPPPLPAAIPPDQPRPDVRGFLAGFVLSGALGAVLYLYMMAG
jgi:hypothetical protein